MIAGCSAVEIERQDVAELRCRKRVLAGRTAGVVSPLAVVCRGIAGIGDSAGSNPVLRRANTATHGRTGLFDFVGRDVEPRHAVGHRAGFGSVERLAHRSAALVPVAAARRNVCRVRTTCFEAVHPERTCHGHVGRIEVRVTHLGDGGFDEVRRIVAFVCEDLVNGTVAVVVLAVAIFCGDFGVVFDGVAHGRAVAVADVSAGGSTNTLRTGR